MRLLHKVYPEIFNQFRQDQKVDLNMVEKIHIKSEITGKKNGVGRKWSSRFICTCINTSYFDKNGSFIADAFNEKSEMSIVSLWRTIFESSIAV